MQTRLADSVVELPPDVEDDTLCLASKDDELPGGKQQKLALPDARGQVVLPQDVGSEAETEKPTAESKRMGDATGVNHRRHSLRQGPSRAELSFEHGVALQEPFLLGLQVVCNAMQDSVAEVYSPRRVLRYTSQMDLRGDLSADLLTRWDFNDQKHRELLVGELKKRRPRVLILSPPCTMFSSLMASNWLRMERRGREERWKEANLHLSFAVLLCNLQRSNGLGFIFEHPASALSWKSPVLQALASQPRCWTSHFHMCAFGMHAADDPSKYHKKNTRLLTNVPQVHKLVHNKTCPGNHEHIPITGSAVGMKRSYWAQHYPANFCKALADATRDYCRA